jgi:hypothetical protein
MNSTKFRTALTGLALMVALALTSAGVADAVAQATQADTTPAIAEGARADAGDGYATANYPAACDAAKAPAFAAEGQEASADMVAAAKAAELRPA